MSTSPVTMRAVVAERFGDPAEVLAVRERPLPLPGPSEVRVRVLLSPIHTHDLEQVRGEYGDRPALPMAPGTEAVGRIEAIGIGVTGLQLGQRVCVAGASGTWAECFVVRAERVVPCPTTPRASCSPCR
jgi:NADPH:quinone reductase